MRFPSWTFQRAELPLLDGVDSHAFDNVLCETVIMHLRRASIADAIDGLCRILSPDGTLYLSWRVGGAEQRDARGRLYSACDADFVRAALLGMTVLYSEEAVSASSGKRIHAVAARAQ